MILSNIQHIKDNLYSYESSETLEIGSCIINDTSRLDADFYMIEDNNIMKAISESTPVDGAYFIFHSRPVGEYDSRC